MRLVMFYHSLVSDWNHGNAHFLRGVAKELVRRGHRVDIFEPCDGWSLHNLQEDHGTEPLDAFRRAYPQLRTNFFYPERFDIDAVLADADAVIVHEWNDPLLVARIGDHHRRSPHYRLLFHDTHHRAVTEPEQMARYDLRHYDGILAFGRIIRDLYLQRGMARRAWTWHEAADTDVFRPRLGQPPAGDLVWIGNWGDDERTEELHRFLIEPVRRLGLKARVYGVRYPRRGLRALRRAGIEYGGWLPNFQVPEIFARFRLTLHIPRRPYREDIPGVPTIRVFEALASGIPLVSLRWDDDEGLFNPGSDYLTAETADGMTHRIRTLLDNPHLARQLATHGRRTILDHHTCAHRVDQLLVILGQLDAEDRPPAGISRRTSRIPEPPPVERALSLAESAT